MSVPPCEMPNPAQAPVPLGTSSLTSLDEGVGKGYCRQSAPELHSNGLRTALDTPTTT